MNLFNALIPLVEKSAPILGSVLGTPFAGIAVSLISHLFGVQNDDVNQTIEAIKSNPNSEFMLKQLEDTHSEALKRINSQDYTTEVQDRMSARNNEKDDKHFWFLAVISMIFILGFFIFIYLMLMQYFSDAKDSHQVFDILSNSSMLVISYWLGSCHKKN